MIALSRAAPRITGLVLLNEFPETPTSGFPDSGALIEARRSIEDGESARTQTPARRALEWWYRRRLALPAYDRAGLDGGNIPRKGSRCSALGEKRGSGRRGGRRSRPPDKIKACTQFIHSTSPLTISSTVRSE